MLFKNGKSIREPVRDQKIISFFNRNKNNDNQKHLDVSIFPLRIGPKNERIRVLHKSKYYKNL